MSSMEMQDLSNRSRASTTNQGQDQPDDVEKDDTIAFWTMTAASLLALLAAILSLFPQLLIFLSETTVGGSERSTVLTPLERFLATHFGIWLFTIAVALVLNIPSHSPLGMSPPNHPLLGPFTTACLFSSFLSYNTRSVGSLAPVHCVISGVVGLWGLWVVVFGSSGRVSKKTGADKRTSAFIFGNKSAASKQKKEWAKQQKPKDGR